MSRVEKGGKRGRREREGEVGGEGGREKEKKGERERKGGRERFTLLFTLVSLPSPTALHVQRCRN